MAGVGEFVGYALRIAFSTSYEAALAGVILWGAAMGIQGSIMRAVVAGMIPANGRGTAYGIFNTGYGLFWFAGSALMGVLYGIGIAYLIVFSVVRELSEALKRQCLHLQLEYPSAEVELRIVRLKAPGMGEALSQQLVGTIQEIRKLNLRKAPSIGEMIDYWA